MAMLKYWTVLVDTYEREDSTAEQRREVFEAINELVRKKDDELKGQGRVCARIVSIYCREIRAMANGVPPTVEKWLMALCLERCLSIISRTIQVSATSSAIDAMMHEEGIFKWICEGIESDDETEHDDFCYLLSRIVSVATITDRTTLSVRYPDLLQKMADPTRFARLIPSGAERDCDHIGYCPHMDVCVVILCVLKSALDSPKTLEALLGYGLLWISHHYSLVSDAEGSVEAAQVFRRILEKFPCWNQQFRQWTKDGDEGNPTADMGRSIPPKVATAGVDFVWYEEDDNT